ncbi:hypothetical protein P692DRAFT_201811507 [Suillus brevipes Sb2]|nr:hypothetical protein P692DRAFT_201811507 [Suillus brevipes Sb2]
MSAQRTLLNVSWLTTLDTYNRPVPQLAVVSPPTTVATASPATRKLAAQAAGGDRDASRVTVFDMENKVVGYTGMFPEGVREVISEWGNIYILINNGQLTRLTEKFTSAKLSMVSAKALYPLALSLAQTQHLDESYVADIHHQHIFFPDTTVPGCSAYTQSRYLSARVHALGLANADHTALLLNTYTKLKDIAHLDSFIKTESRRSGAAESNGDLPFDLDTAIRVCRQAGYFDHASYLAKRYQRHEEYLKVMIEDAGKYGEALTYLRHLGAAAVESNLARYGRAMLDNLPEETTQLLIDLCTVSGPLTMPEAEDTTPQQSSTPAEHGHSHSHGHSHGDKESGHAHASHAKPYHPQEALSGYTRATAILGWKKLDTGKCTSVCSDCRTKVNRTGVSAVQPDQSTRATPSPQAPPLQRLSSRPVSPPPHIVGQIVEMGLSPQQARIALAATDTGLDVQAALETLLANGAGNSSTPPPSSRDHEVRPPLRRPPNQCVIPVLPLFSHLRSHNAYRFPHRL